MVALGKETRILLVAKDDAVVDEVYRACNEAPSLTLVGHITRTDEAATVARQRRADVVLADDSALSDVEACVMEMSLAAAEQLVIVLVPENDMDLIQRVLLSGARGFVTKPFTPQTLTEAITRVTTLEQLRRVEAHERAAPATHGRIVALVSAKGGVGRSVLAANLAVALQQEDSPVLLMEGMSLPGDVAAILALVPEVTLVDLLTQDGDVSLGDLDDMLPTHSSGVRVLPGAADYRLPSVNPQRFRALLHLLRSAFRFIVVDTGEIFDPLMEIVLTDADQILLVTTPDLPAIYRTLKFWEALEEAGVDRSKVMLVLNGEGRNGGVRRQQMERLMRMRFQHRIRYDEETVMLSVHKGQPFVTAHKRTPIARDVKSLAEALADSHHDGTHRPSSKGESVVEHLRSFFSGASVPVQELSEA